MNITYSRASVKIIGKLDRATKQRIRNAVERLPKGDVKPLSGSACLYRLRVGDWRIAFSYPDGNTVLIEKKPHAGKFIRGDYCDCKEPIVAAD